MNKQKILNELDKMKNRINELEQELNKTEKEWIPEYNEKYWYYDKDLEQVHYLYWVNRDSDKTRLKNKVIFQTKEKAQRYADYQKAKEEYSYKFSKEEWEDNSISKYYIYYNYSEKNLLTSVDWGNQILGRIYFKTRNQVQEFIDKYKAEILEFEFGIKE